MKVAQALVERLEGLGVRRVYGLIGTSILDLVDALRDSGMRYISTRHDQAAVAMAAGEGRVTGRPGVAAVHGGPGFLNALTAFAVAYKDSIPLVMISGAVKRRLQGLDSWLEVPQRRMIAPVAKAILPLEGPREAGRIAAQALGMASRPPAGPVLIEVPEDVWRLDGGADGHAPELDPVPRVSDRDLGDVLRRLERSASPLILAGGGLNTPRGAEALLRIVHRWSIPVATTGNGRGALPEDHPLSLGRVGFGGGSTAADRALGTSDLVLALGAGLSDVTTYAYACVPRGETIAVTLDPMAGKRPVPYAALLQGDAIDFAERLSQAPMAYRPSGAWSRAIEGYRAEWEALCREAAGRSYEGFVNPSRLLRELDPRLPRDAILAAGQGLHILYAYGFLRVRSPASFLAATNLGAMGFAFPAALGAKAALPAREVLAILGDGEFLMTLPDLETAVRERLGVRIIVVNDNAYRVLLMRQRIQRMGRVFGTVHTNPDAGRLGEAFGLAARVLASDDQIPAAVEFALAERPGPSLLELRVSPEDLPPLNLEASLKF